MNTPKRKQGLNPRTGSLRRKLPLLLVVAIILAARSVQAEFVASIEQVGSDVVVIGSGAINLPTGFNMGAPQIYSPEVVPDRSEVYLGGLGMFVSGPSLTGPGSIGSGAGFDVPSIFSGPPVGVFCEGGSGNLLIPYQYVSGSPLAIQDTFPEATFSSLGLTEGTYTWTWAVDQTSDSFTLNIGAVPEPSTTAFIGLAACGVCGVGLIRRVRRKIAA